MIPPYLNTPPAYFTNPSMEPTFMGKIHFLGKFRKMKPLISREGQLCQLCQSSSKAMTDREKPMHLFCLQKHFHKRNSFSWHSTVLSSLFILSKFHISVNFVKNDKYVSEIILQTMASKCVCFYLP